MNIVALVEAEDHVCCRYRIAAFRPHLEAAGHTLGIQAIPKGIVSRLRLLNSVGDADVVILQRKLLSQFEVAWLRRKARRLIFDFDDAIYLRDSHSGKGFDDAKRMRRFRSIVASADAVVAGNAILAEQADPKATVIPTCIDISKYQPHENVCRKDHIELVWVGSSSTLKGLESQRTLFEEIGRSIPELRLTVICDRFPKFEHLPVQEIPWQEATEAVFIARADIGIAWVPDDPWSRGKCALKVLQYHAAGLPVVANPVGVQAEIVRPGVNGYLASTTDQWVSAIHALVTNEHLRRGFGMAGREQVRTQFSTDIGGAMWVELLNRVGRGGAC